MALAGAPGCAPKHAEVRIGDSVLFGNDTFPVMPGGAPRQARLWIYLEGVDRAFDRATSAGLKGF